MANIINEIDEDIARERYERLWKRYGPWLIGLCVFVVLGTAGLKGWQAYDENRSQARASAFAQAIALPTSENANFQQKIDQLDGLTDSADGFGQLAQWNIASAALESGDHNTAVDMYNTIAASNSTDVDFRTWARLMALQASAQTPPADWQARIETIIVDEPQWATMAMITAAIIAIETGDEATAKTQLQALFDVTDNIPPVLLDLLASLE